MLASDCTEIKNSRPSQLGWGDGEQLKGIDYGRAGVMCNIEKENTDADLQTIHIMNTQII